MTNSVQSRFTYTTISKTFLHDFLVILKHSLQNYQKRLKKCFLGTISIQMCLEMFESSITNQRAIVCDRVKRICLCHEKQLIIQVTCVKQRDFETRLQRGVINCAQSCTRINLFSRSHTTYICSVFQTIEGHLRSNLNNLINTVKQYVRPK